MTFILLLYKCTTLRYETKTSKIYNNLTFTRYGFYMLRTVPYILLDLNMG